MTTRFLSVRVLRFAIMWSVLVVNTSWADHQIQDGTYDAEVTTDSGTYSVPVEVEDGEVTGVEWPNGGTMSVHDADIDDGQAEGNNSRGDSVSIEIDDPEYEDDAEDDEE